MIKVQAGLLVLFIIGIFLVLFWEPLFYYFSQDDFFHLRVAMEKNFSDIPSFFVSLQKEYAFYRPLSRETFNLLMYQSFGLNPLPFHLVNLTLILTNIFLVFLVMKRLSQNVLTSYLAALLYAVSSIHSIELYYLASVQTLLATLFLLISFFSYLSFYQKQKPKLYILTLLFFILALTSHETALVLPGILFLAEVIFLGNTKNILTKGFVLRVLPFCLAGIIYLINTSLLANLPNQEVYRPAISLKSMANTLSWYTLWSFGLSEILVDFVGSKFTINPNLLKWYLGYITIVILLFIFLVLSLGYFLFRFKKIIIKNKLIPFFITAYIISLSPFLFFPQHKSSYYLGFSTVFFTSALAVIFGKVWNINKFFQIWVILAIIALILISYQTTKLNKLTFWAAKRAKAASYLISDIGQKIPHPSTGTIFYIRDDPNYPFIAKEWGSSSKQAFYILSGADAFKLFYQDPTLQVYFEGKDGLPVRNHANIIEYKAQFPY